MHIASHRPGLEEWKSTNSYLSSLPCASAMICANSRLFSSSDPTILNLGHFAFPQVGSNVPLYCSKKYTADETSSACM